MQMRIRSWAAVATFLLSLGACNKPSPAASYDRLCAAYCSNASNERHAVDAALHAVDKDLDAVGKLAPKNDAEQKQSAEQTQTSCVDVHEQLAFARGQMLGMRDARVLVDDRVGNEASFAEDLASAARDVPPCASASPAQLASYKSRMVTVEKTFADEFHDDPACVATCNASAAKKLGGGS